MRNRGFMPYLAGFAVSAVLLSLSTAGGRFSFWPLAWVGYVPFVVVCSPRARPVLLSAAAWLAGSVFWLVNIYWIGYVTVGGWVAFCLYTALLWPVMALSVRYCRRKKVPLVIAVPVVVVAAENLQGLFLGGFYWHYLAHSQYANISLIQLADIFGAAGVSFLVAMVSGELAELVIAVRNGRFFSARNLITAAVVGGLLVGAFVYGRWRIAQSEEFVTQGPLAAAVQSNVPQAVKQSFSAEQQIFDDLLEQSRQCVAAGARLVTWPETMVQAPLNEESRHWLASPQQSVAFDSTLKKHALNKAFLLVGAYDIRPRLTVEKGVFDRYNSAFLYQPDGTQSPQRYSKIHLVPFGEYIPFKHEAPVLHKLLLGFTPYDYDYTIEPGSEYTVFEMTATSNEREARSDERRVYRFGVMICYEDAVPAMARRFALDEQGRKRIDWLVNISNDGWFVKFSNGQVLASTELAQHTAVCAFRAVENRIAILRSVNTGISCLIDSLGRIRDDFVAGNLPKKALERKGIAGWFADNMPIDERTTFFSRYGRWLDYACQICLGMLIVAQFCGLFSKRKKNIQRAKNTGAKK